MIVQGLSRFKYSSPIMLRGDFEAFGLRKTAYEPGFDDLTASMDQLARQGEIAFVAIDPYFLPHRDEYRKRHGMHWIMLCGYSEKEAVFSILDEVQTYYSFFEYASSTLREAYHSGIRKSVTFKRIPPNYELLNQRYVNWYKALPTDHSKFFGCVVPLLEQQISGSDTDGSSYADKLFNALSFFSGSMEVTGQFFVTVDAERELITLVTEIAKIAENLASVIKKFDLTGKINLNYIRDRLSILEQLHAEALSKLKSEDFARFLLALDIGPIANANPGLSSGEQTVRPAIAQKNHGTGKAYRIDLEPFYNNQAFGAKGSAADLTGGGEFMRLEEHVFLSSDISANFQMAARFGFGYDNISCDGQAVPLPELHGNTIRLLCCGEWGDPEGELELIFADGTTDFLNIKVTDWAWSPRYGEEVAIQAPIERKEKIPFAPEEGHVFANDIPISEDKPLSVLKLPYCPNLHIFSITVMAGR
ncbi:hypothetical protein V3851_06405 [Paenibacillus sp. M1]|uniref:Uncharacterized protein n=1 Tax=Paenibacillus haidiansis TaxID=1574488 RepID=A0ABU7VQH0_9BACL